MQAIHLNLIKPMRYVIVRCPMKKHLIDTPWFLRRMDDLNLSMHTVAPMVEGLNGKLDYSSFYRMIHGVRAMSLSEAMQLSDILKTPIETIAKKALGKGR